MLCTMKLLLFLLILSVSFYTSVTQFPTYCMTSQNLAARKCCPPLNFDGSECGSADGRGQCEQIVVPSDKQSVRDSWPYYFDHVCKCNHNFSGYDCGRCKYGHFGENCNDSKIIERKPISEYTAEEWKKYVKIIAESKTHPSRYQVFLVEPQPAQQGVPNLNDVANISIYDLFVWQHHYPSKDNDNKELLKDYAHESTGFLTWHRQYLLWFEWEIQYMLKSMGKDDYYTFRIPYWDWRKEQQTEEKSPFKTDRLGKTVISNTGFPKLQVDGDIFGNNWQTVCWSKSKNKSYDICDPRIKTGQLQRCPLDEYCSSNSHLWPTDNDVQTVLSLQQYDTDPFSLNSSDSFRNRLEGFKPLSASNLQECISDKLCTCNDGDTNCKTGVQPLQRLLHNSIHIILGIGYFGSSASDDPNKSGVMGDVAASANDPIFLNHHAMVDCIFETWLQNNPSVQYPTSPDNIPRGHRMQDYIVPFFPLYKHEDMLFTANQFGYKCELKSVTVQHQLEPGEIAGIIISVVFIVVILAIIVTVFVVYKLKKNKRIKYEDIR